MLVMKKAPAVLEGAWSPLLKQIAPCAEAANGIADFLLLPFHKKELQQELKGLLATNLAYLTPSTPWFLEQKQFTQVKAQQHNRLKVTFCVHDSFEDEPGSLINLAATLKSPLGLVDTFLKAITRSKKPLSSKEVIVRYDDCLKHIQGDAQLNMVKEQHLSQWHRLLFGNNPIDLGLSMEKYQKKLAAANPEVKSLLGDSWADHTDSFFHH